MKKRKRMKVTKVIWLLLGVYFLFALIVSTVPYALSKPVSESAKERFADAEYSGRGEGPDRVMLVETPAESLGMRIELVREARETLDIVYHTVQPGDSTDAFFGEVLQAADRGVRVRIVIDGMVGAMEPGSRRIIKGLNSHPNISCRGYNTLNIAKPWAWHTLLHDKFIIMDGEMVLLGGRNIGDRYYPHAESKKQVLVDDREVLVWNRGDERQSVLGEVTAYMELLWESPDTTAYRDRGAFSGELREKLETAAGEFQVANPHYYAHSMEEYKKNTVPTAKVTLLYNPINVTKKEPWVGYQIRQLVREAEECVLIQTPYATANKDLLEALAEAGGRLDVSILTNSLPSSPNFPAFSNYYANRKKFIGTGAKFYEYQSKNSIHGKSLIVDNRWSIVGSFNMDDRSFYIDTETMFVIDSPEFAEVMEEAIGHYVDQSLQVGPDNRYLEGEAVELPASAGKRALMWVVSIFSRLFQFLI